MYKDLLKLNNKNMNNLKKEAKTLTDHFPKEILMANKYVKRCYTAYVIKEMQNKIMRCHKTPIKMTQV